MPGSEKMVMLMKQLQDMVKDQYPTVSIDMMTTCILTELYGQISLTPPLDPENLFHKLSCKTDVPAQKFFFSIWSFEHPQSTQIITFFPQFPTRPITNAPRYFQVISIRPSWYVTAFSAISRIKPPGSAFSGNGIISRVFEMITASNVSEEIRSMIVGCITHKPVN